MQIDMFEALRFGDTVSIQQCEIGCWWITFEAHYADGLILQYCDVDGLILQYCDVNGLIFAVL